VTRSGNREPSICIGRSRVDPDRTKPAFGSLRRTLALIRSSSRRVAARAVTALPRALSPIGAAVERLLDRALPARHSRSRRRPVERWEEDGAAVGPLADARARRWVDVQPSSGSSVGPTRTHPQDLGAAVF
jgi:hypothetical protein